MSRPSFRLKVLALHLNAPAFPPDSLQDVNTQSRSISQQECAAVCTLKFARTAAPVDVLFAVPAAEAPSSAQLEALGAANDTIDSICSTAASAIADFPLPSTFPSDSSAQDTSPPLFARPETSDIFIPSNQGEENTTILPAFSSEEKEKPRDSIIASSGHWAPQASVIENEFGYVLQAVLPGVNVKEVRAELLPGGRLVISGIRHQSSSGIDGGGGGGVQPALLSILPEVFGEPGLSKVVHDGHVLESGRFRLVWRLPKDANLESIRADFKDGCLLVTVTKESVFSLF